MARRFRALLRFFAYGFNGFFGLFADGFGGFLRFLSYCLSGFLGFFASRFKPVFNGLASFLCSLFYVLQCSFLRKGGECRRCSQDDAVGLRLPNSEQLQVEIGLCRRAFHPVNVPRAIHGDECERVRWQPCFVNHFSGREIETARAELKFLAVTSERRCAIDHRV